MHSRPRRRLHEQREDGTTNRAFAPMLRATEEAKARNSCGSGGGKALQAKRSDSLG